MTFLQVHKDMLFMNRVVGPDLEFLDPLLSMFVIACTQNQRLLGRFLNTKREGGGRRLREQVFPIHDFINVGTGKRIVAFQRAFVIGEDEVVFI